MRECRNFVFRFISIIIAMILINIIFFGIFQKKSVSGIINFKNEKALNKNINIVDKYILEEKNKIYYNSKIVVENIEKKSVMTGITAETIIKGIIEENDININYYIEVYDKSGKTIGNSFGYTEKIEIFDKILKRLEREKNGFLEIVSGENNIYIKSVFPFGDEKKEYIAVVSYKLSEDFFDKAKNYINGDINIYNKNMEIVLTTLKGDKQAKIKKKSQEIKDYRGEKNFTYSNKEQSGILKKIEESDVSYEIFMNREEEKTEIEKYFYFIVLFELLFLGVILALLLKFIKNITGTDKEFWKKMKNCMLGKEEKENQNFTDILDYNLLFCNAKDIFIKNISEYLKEVENGNRVNRINDMVEIYSVCFTQIKRYKIEDVEIISMMKIIEGICSKYNIRIEIKKNKSKMYSSFEKNSVIYIFISLIYKLSEIYNSIKINVTIEDYGRKIFIKFKSEDTGIKIEDNRCLKSMFNKEFIDYLLMVNELGYAEKNGTVEISINV